MVEADVIRCPGAPEYLVIFPGGHIGFVIFIRDYPGEQTKKAIRELRLLGCAAAAIENERHVLNTVNYILSDAGRDPAWRAYKDYLEYYEKHGAGGDAK